MIIYQMKKPIECYDTDCVGVTGDNIAYTQYFYIKGVSDNSISYTLHLRFADGSVNSITPDVVIPDGEGTEIRWIVKKNDIFAHGYFELQIEGRNKIGLVFQTEIVRLYADESLPVEDREYENPNSETLKLREEAYAALEEIKKQQAQIEENVNKIEQTDLNNKADKSTTLSGYGITDGENTSNKVSDKAKITDESANYPSIQYLNEYYYDYNEIDDALTGKLDNAAGAVATDNIADKAVTSAKIANGAVTALKLANNCVSSSTIAENQINTAHLQSGAVTNDKLSDEVKTSIDGKYDSANVENGSGELSVYTQTAIDDELIKSCTFDYQKTGKVVNIFFNIVFNEGSINYLQFTGLPFKCNSVSDQNKYITASNKFTQAIAYPLGSWLVLNFITTKTFVQDETLKGILTIEIS